MRKKGYVETCSARGGWLPDPGAHALTHPSIFMASLPAPQGPDLVLSTGVLHDNDYYYSTGDSVIRIENTLFKVRTAIILRYRMLTST
jgi:hypothetical protein